MIDRFIGGKVETLLSPQNSKTSVELEMAHIMNCATKNKITLNLHKTTRDNILMTSVY